VRVFAEGYPGWIAYAGENSGAALASTEPKSGGEEGSIDIEYFKELVEKDPASVHLIDVRDADEFAKGSLKTSVNIPVDKLEDQVKSLPSDKPIVFICGTGARSGESFYMLQDLRPELKNVFYLDAEMTFGKDGSFTITKPNTSS
jgi:rhodanese-related sulfurtransferase